VKQRGEGGIIVWRSVWPYGVSALARGRSGASASMAAVIANKHHGVMAPWQ